MRLLIDTHLLLWALGDPGRLGTSFRNDLEDSANQILFSTASICEIAIKAGLRKADFTARPEVIAGEALARGFSELQIGWRAAAAVTDPRHLHRDPFDRLIIAQALTSGLTLATRDSAFDAYAGLDILKV